MLLPDEVLELGLLPEELLVLGLLIEELLVDEPEPLPM